MWSLNLHSMSKVLNFTILCFIFYSSSIIADSSSIKISEGKFNMGCSPGDDFCLEDEGREGG